MPPHFGEGLLKPPAGRPRSPGVPSHFGQGLLKPLTGRPRSPGVPPHSDVQGSGVWWTGKRIVSPGSDGREYQGKPGPDQGNRVGVGVLGDTRLGPVVGRGWTWTPTDDLKEPRGCRVLLGHPQIKVSTGVEGGNSRTRHLLRSPLRDGKPQIGSVGFVKGRAGRLGSSLGTCVAGRVDRVDRVDRGRYSDQPADRDRTRTSLRTGTGHQSDYEGLLRTGHQVYKC